MAQKKEPQQLGDYDINLNDEVGRGSFGVVYRGKHYKTSTNVVAKVISLHTIPKEYAEKEISILKLGKRHANIVQILFDEHKGDEIWIVMEECDLGNLAQYAMKYYMDVYTKVDIVYQCSQALVYLLNLQPHRVIHRDLKPNNILLVSKGGITAKLSDFGMSKRVDSNSATKLCTQVGCLHFMAPEMFDSDEKAMYNRSVDVFSLALIAFYLLKVKVGDDMNTVRFLGFSIGAKMFGSENKNWTPVKMEDSDPKNVTLVKQFLMRTLVLDKKQRPSMEEVLEQLATLKTRIHSMARTF